MQVLKVDYESPDAAKQFTKSLHETGFAVIENHPIQTEKLNKLYNEWKAFFAGDDKHNYLYNKEDQNGYYPFRSENAKGNDYKNLMEYYHYYLWGRHPQQISQLMPEVFKEMMVFAMELLQWLQADSPQAVKDKISMPFDKMVEGSPRNLMRVIHYPPLTGDEEDGEVRAAEHEDICMLTVLAAASAPGLQAKDTEGNWHAVKCDPNCLVINAGDMLQECSAGYYPSTTHRVVNPPEGDKGDRFSMPLFVHANPEVRLSDRYLAEEYLLERLRENGVVE